jgi:cytochrome c oxidase subunit II
MGKAARRWSFRTAVIFSLVILATFILSAGAFAQSGPPAGITKEAKDIYKLFWLVSALAIIVFVLVEAALVFMLIRFQKKNDDLPPQTHGNNALEVVWTSIPIVIVLILFVFSFVVLTRVEKDSDAQDLTINVEGFQFCWTFSYDLADLGTSSSSGGEGTVEVTEPNCEAVEPVLTIPVGEPVEFKLNSNDVMHSFYIRDFLYKLDLIPGRENSFRVHPTEIGSFTGQCAELCGVNHSLMRFKVNVVSRADFDTFIARQKAAAATTAAAAPK